MLLQELGNADVEIREAAISCFKSLSRAIRQLRNHLVDAGLASPLVRVCTTLWVILRTVVTFL